MAEAGEIEVGIAVVVVIAPSHAFDKANVVDAALGCDIGEGAVALVLVELAGVPLPSVGFVADIEVEVAVVVVVAPSSRVGRVKGEQAGRFGRIDESTAAIAQ